MQGKSNGASLKFVGIGQRMTLGEMQVVQLPLNKGTRKTQRIQLGLLCLLDGCTDTLTSHVFIGPKSDNRCLPGILAYSTTSGSGIYQSR